MTKNRSAFHPTNLVRMETADNATNFDQIQYLCANRNRTFLCRLYVDSTETLERMGSQAASVMVACIEARYRRQGRHILGAGRVCVLTLVSPKPIYALSCSSFIIKIKAAEITQTGTTFICLNNSRAHYSMHRPISYGLYYAVSQGRHDP